LSGRGVSGNPTTRLLSMKRSRVRVVSGDALNYAPDDLKLLSGARAIAKINSSFSPLVTDRNEIVILMP